MLGSFSEAEDAVQGTWPRLNSTGTREVENLGGWLTTVVGRVCLNMLRSRGTRREDSWDADLPDAVAGDETGIGPEQQAVLADSVGQAMLVVLDTLAPAERPAFVLHDMSAVRFDEIAPAMERTPAFARRFGGRSVRRRYVPHRPGNVTGAEADSFPSGARISFPSCTRSGAGVQ